MYELYGEYYENVIGKRSYGITCGCVQELECINEHSGKINICNALLPFHQNINVNILTMCMVQQELGSLQLMIPFNFPS